MRSTVNYSQLNLLASDFKRYAAALSSTSEPLARNSATRNIQQTIQVSCDRIQQLGTALESIAAEYAATEAHLCSTTPSDAKRAGDVSQAFSGASQDYQLLLGNVAWDLLGGVNKIGSYLKDAGDYSEWIDVLFSSDMFGDISDVLDDVAKNDVFKITGYLSDGKKLIDALNDKNSDVLEDLVEKYAKKGVKLGIKSATGVKVTGVVNNVYLDLGWNLGENTVESYHDFTEDPSFESGLTAIWNMTAGTLFDTGTGLAEDALSFVGDVTGQGFDTEDFGNAMDYLWQHPFKSAVATGEVIVDWVTSFFGW